MVLFPALPVPRFAPDHEATTPGQLRYEDCAQDGRLMPIALPPAMGGFWQSVLLRHPGAERARAQGILPLLTRLTITTHDQPIRIDRPIETHAGFELAHARTGDAITRLYMNVWCEVRGIGGRIGHRPDGPLVAAGQLFAEHTFTRPFAPADQRRVTRFDVDGFPEVPATLYDAPPPTTAQEAPEGARWLDELAPDPGEVAFTLDQTDANQHVNSLVYIRVFLDAVQRRLARGGHPLRVGSRAVDIAYRKPCFAGDRVRVQLRLFDHAGTIGAAGLIAGVDDDKPRCFVRISLTP